MPVVTKPCASDLRKRRSGCDEECLRRIAARLRRLDESCEFDRPDTANATECCGLEIQESTGNDSYKPAVDCCRPNATVKDCDISKKAVEAKTNNLKASENDCCRAGAAFKSCCDLGDDANAGTCGAPESLSSTKATKDNRFKLANEPVDDCYRSKTASKSCCDPDEEAISTSSVQGRAKQTNTTRCCSSKSQGGGECGRNDSDTTKPAALFAEFRLDSCCRNEPGHAESIDRYSATTEAGTKSPRRARAQGSHRLRWPWQRYPCSDVTVVSV